MNSREARWDFTGRRDLPIGRSWICIAAGRCLHARRPRGVLATVGDSAGSWLERWLATTSDLARLQYAHRMVDAVIDEIDGRMVRIGDRWLADFASCNYLGFDLEPQIIDAVEPYLDARGARTPAGRACSAARCSTSRSRSN